MKQTIKTSTSLANDSSKNSSFWKKNWRHITTGVLILAAIMMLVIAWLYILVFIVCLCMIVLLEQEPINRVLKKVGVKVGDSP